MLAVGVTINVDEPQLKLISSKPHQLNLNYFMRIDFTKLKTLIDGIVGEACRPKEVGRCPLLVLPVA